MSRSEDPTLIELEHAASATGEIHSITGGSIGIRGHFTPGQALLVRPGTRVFVITVDDADEFLDKFTADAAEDAAAGAAFDTAQSVADKLVSAAKAAVGSVDPAQRSGAESVVQAVKEAAKQAKRGNQ
ncbi:hypothetical protein [Mycobacteroides abscessus]|uniref:hypothetical protein n=1 Tax=Mycobacteroides abscessus TaxID=36809 RepID=UPI0009276D35|nr:hypothetical protein [Mycobacteroides abscessus]MBE5440171.1 hypothetical protein [Mycobacteroides abscessus]SID46351.1 Uncharacterised protein [Mycobacteroides abscessus subsp. abscessus]SIG27790.1 Uncharacterised protein [Mycobacteroides abscessus subsp. abscessus]SKU08630.1 Uncharacterised protein [Mycobacteroides abscessus subsp. abscessus]